MLLTKQILEHCFVFIETLGVVLHRRDFRFGNYFLFGLLSASDLLLPFLDGFEQLLVHKNII